LPAAPWISTVCPATSFAWSNSAWRAVTAITGIDAASMSLIVAGLRAIMPVAAMAYSA
jgi:hypothetical protein